MLTNKLSAFEMSYGNSRRAGGSDTLSSWRLAVFYNKRIRSALVVLTALISFVWLNLVPAFSQSNQSSPLGTNLIEVNYWTTDQPFLNIFKTASGWAGNVTSGARYEQSQNVFNLDANGYPKSMSGVGIAAGQTFSEFDTLVLRSLGVNGGNTAPFYSGGRYVVLYDGAGTLAYSFDAVKNNSYSAPGRDVLDVTPSSGGIRINITATDPQNTGNYVRNIRLVYAPTATNTVIDPNETLLANGEYFNSSFINHLSPFKTVRFMKWQDTVNDMTADWSTRTLLSSAFWSKPPVEVMVALCNKIGADGWFDMPILSTDDYVTQFATLVHSTLNSYLKAYVEYGNEIWNNGAIASALWTQLVAKGSIAFPTSGSDFGSAFNYAILRAVQNGATWKQVWGADAARVVRIAAGQNGYTGRNQYILGFTAGSYGGDPSKFTGTAGQNVDAFSTAPYFGYAVPDTFTLDQLFTEINSGGLVSGGYPGGMIKQALDYAASDYSVAHAVGLPLVAYEGGQTLVDYSHSDTALQNLYAAANRDPRMGAAYTNYFNSWRNLGGTLFVNFTLTSSYSQWGYWGALENILQTSTPRYDALMNFISANPCWWNNCTPTTTTIAPTPTTTTIAPTPTTTTTAPTPITTATAPTPTTTTTAPTPTTTTTAPTPITTTTTPTPTTPPTVAIQSPGNGAVYKANGAVNITVSASDPNGVASITVSGDASALMTCTHTTSCAATWQGKKLTRGTHIISATAVNKLGLPANTSITIVDLK